MKKIILIIIYISGNLFAQYYNERSAEQNYENSALYFNSHFLNTFGVSDFEKMAPGLFDDPFMNIYLNPAKLPVLNKDILVYLDFRGDRNESDLVAAPIYPHYFLDSYYLPPADSRWNSVAREEPEPFVSLGFLAKINSDDKLPIYIGGSYQFISKSEPYYTMPYGIYELRYNSDSFGNAYLENSRPVVDRYKGEDEMTNRAHLYTLYLGGRLSEKLTAGIFANGVIHSRNGNYLNENNDDYGNIDNQEYSNLMSREKEQDYDHYDIQFGLEYEFSHTFQAGIKLGVLNGNSDQKYSAQNNYDYKYNDPDVSDEWSYNYSRSSTEQSWTHEGDTKYFGVDFTKRLNPKKTVTGYYRYSKTSVDTRNQSSIIDTSFYNSRWNYSTGYYLYQGVSSTYDIRTGTGTREIKNHQAQLSFLWEMNERVKIRSGIFLESDICEVESREPVDVKRMYDYQNQNYNNYSSSYLLIEDKDIVWKYNSDRVVLQIPVVLEYSPINELTFIIGINRIYTSWEITEVSTGFYRKRMINEDGTAAEEKDFAERYTEPRISITDDDTDLILGMDVKVSDDLNAKLIIDPEFSHGYKIRQWWLSLRAFL